MNRPTVGDMVRLVERRDNDDLALAPGGTYEITRDDHDDAPYWLDGIDGVHEYQVALVD